MSAAPTLQDYFDAGKAEAIDRRPDLTFDEGDISEFYMYASSAMADHLTGYVAGRIKATYLDGAIGDDLSTLGDDHWNIQRNDAVAATGVLTFSRVNHTAGGGTIPAGTTVSTVADALGKTVQFTTDSDLVFGATDEILTVNATASDTGLTGNTDVNKIVLIVPQLFDPIITVNNVDRFAGGTEQEADENYRERIRQYPSTIRRGTLAALEYGALTIAGVATAVADDSANDGAVAVYITDSSGSSSPTLVAAVATELVNWRAAGIAVNVSGGELVAQDVAVTLTVRAGINTTTLVTLIQSAVTARLKKLRIGEICAVAIIKQAVMNVSTDIVNCVVTLPVGDVQPSANQIIRAGSVTVS